MPTPPLPLPPLFCTLPVPLNYSPTPALGISPSSTPVCPSDSQDSSCGDDYQGVLPRTGKQALWESKGYSLSPQPLCTPRCHSERGESRQHCTEGKNKKTVNTKKGRQSVLIFLGMRAVLSAQVYMRVFVRQRMHIGDGKPEPFGISPTM